MFPVGRGRDWSEEWKAARARGTRRGGREAWDARAPGFSWGSGQSSYVERLLELVGARPGESVLDVGCGPGTLALPLARRGCRVTALDFSPGMLEQLTSRCAAEGIVNVTPVLGAWEDDWDQLGIARCDVALASRSLSVDDLAGALEKLQRAARRRVIFTSPAGEGPIDRRLFEAVGRPYLPGPDYLYPLNLLLDRGVLPTVNFIPVTRSRAYAGVDEAFENLRWMLPEPTGEELARMRDWLARELAPQADGTFALPPRTVRWAALSWNLENPT